MAEAAGLAVGVISLAGLFSTTIQCFEFIQLGRACEKDFKTAQLKLDVCELRLSRWGASLGLNHDLQPAQISADTFGSEKQVVQAQSLLTQILELFEEVEELSAKFKTRREPTSTELAIYDPQSDLGPSATVLHSQMRRLSIDRQSKVSFTRRAKWALFEEKRFRRLIEDVTKLVDDLVNLFPEVQAAQRELCEAESSVLGQSAEAGLLKRIAAQQDRLLQAALERNSAESSRSHHVVINGANNQGSLVGVNEGTISNTFGART